MMKKMLQHTKRMGKISSIIPLQIHHNSSNTLLERTKFSEVCATDTIFLLSKVFKGKMCHNHSQEINRKSMA